MEPSSTSQSPEGAFVTGPTPLSGEQVALTAQRGVFVGRDQELRALRNERQRSALGELRVALVLGEPGMGKTRLAAELLREGELTVSVTARSSPLRRTPPFHRWEATLGRHAHSLDANAVRRASGLPARSRGLHDHPLWHVVGLLTQVAASQPVTVVLDDVHWDEGALWEILLLLSQDHRDSHLFVLATARPGELANHPTAAEPLLALEQELRLSRVHLSRLTQQDVRELAAGIVGQDAVPAALVDWLMEHAQGNPQFTVGLLEALVTHDADLSAPRLVGVCDRVARWIDVEVARLDPSTVTLLELLATIGDGLDLDDLAWIADQPVGTVAFALDRLVRARLVFEQHHHDQSLSYQVAHLLVREALCARAGGAQRRWWRQRAAQMLLEPNRAQRTASRCGRPRDDKAIDTPLEAVRRAQQQRPHSSTWEILLTLLELVPLATRGCGDVADALSWLPGGRLAYRAARFTAIEIQVMRRVQQLLAAVGDPIGQAGVGLRLAGVLAYGAGDLAAGEHACRQTLTLCRQTGCEHEARMAAIELARIAGWGGDLPAQQRGAQRALHEAEEAGDQRAIVQALAAVGYALALQGWFAEAEDMFTRAVELTAAAAYPGLEPQLLALLATSDACQGRMVSARSRWTQAMSSAPEETMWDCGAFIALLAGDLTAVQTYARQAQAHDGPHTQPPQHDRLWAMAVMAAAAAGLTIEARRDLDRALSACQRRDLNLFTPFCCWAEGTLAWAEGQVSDATVAFQRAVDHWVTMGAWALAGFVVADLAEVAVTAGDVDTAARAAARAEQIASRTRAPGYQAVGQFAAAWALLGSGRHGEAAAAALRAAEGFGLCGHALLTARAYVAYASAIRRSDPSAAADALRQATVGFDKCGAVLRREHAHELLAQLARRGGDVPDAVIGPGLLTPRERQVAGLAACGYTARQIAERLHIGTRTVEGHLAHIYPKLSIASKQELVRRGHELGLALRP